MIGLHVIAEAARAAENRTVRRCLVDGPDNAVCYRPWDHTAYNPGGEHDNARGTRWPVATTKTLLV